MLGTYRVTFFKLNKGTGKSMALRWLGWQFCVFEWQRFVWLGVRGAGAPSVDGVEGALGGGRGRLLLAVVDGLVVPEAIEAGIHPPAYVTHWLARGAHVNVLNMAFKPRQRG